MGREGEPRLVRWRPGRSPSRWRRVAAVLDRWRIDDEWWRRPIRRLYYRVALEGEVLLDLYCDLDSGCWYLQRYPPEKVG